jgi:ureidoglycolate amidohydrolase
MNPVAADIQRLQGEIDTLATITEVEPPAVTRILFSEKDYAARAFVRDACTAAGLRVRTDAVGNLFARWEGREPDLPAVATGSHLDAIPHAGRYDGVVGVLGGLEAIRSLQAAGHHPRRSVELIAFTSEEPTRFGIGCLGSRLMSGALAWSTAMALRDADGCSLADWLADSPFAGADAAAVRLPDGALAAFVEMHIEQGPLLERAGDAIGAVTHIAAPAAFRVTLTGQGGHAGGVLMPDRHDALCGAAEFVLALESVARTSGSPDTVATTGVLRVTPGAINSIPAEVAMEIDLRDTQLATRSATWQRALADLAELADRRGLQATHAVINEDPPATCAPELVTLIEEAAAALNLPARRMISRAYHDSLFMARIAPTTMIFVPCRNGWSHRPDEFTSPEHLAGGVTVLARVLAQAAA